MSLTFNQFDKIFSMNLVFLAVIVKEIIKNYDFFFYQARIVVFSINIPITKGYPVLLHYGCVTEQATISKLVSTLSKSTGEVVKNKPRFLNGNCSAMVDITVAKAIPLETYKESVIQLGLDININILGLLLYTPYCPGQKLNFFNIFIITLLRLRVR